MLDVRHRRTRFPAAGVLAAALLCVGSAASAAAASELAGVMVDPVDPGKSVAIIDGRRLRVGSRWQGLELTEIGNGFVRIHETESGRERILTMGVRWIEPSRARAAPGRFRSRSRVAPVSTEPVPRTRAVPVDLASIPEPELLERINPLRLVWMAYTAMAEASLRQVATAQQLFAINDLNYDGRDQYSASLAELAEHRLVQADLAGGRKFGYRFALRAWEDKLGPHFECIAEPVRTDTRQLYLYVDETGVIRGQLHARAGYDSPPVQ